MLLQAFFPQKRVPYFWKPLVCWYGAAGACLSTEKKPPYLFPPNERRGYKFCILRLAGTSSMASSWSQMIVSYIHDTVADCGESLWVLHDILSLRIQIWRSRVRRFAAGSVDIFLQQKTIVEFRDDSSKGKQKC